MGGILSALIATISTSTPGIVTDGLQIYLDAGNSASYPGTGTTWTNIGSSGSTNDGLIYNPNYSSDNGGYFTTNYIAPAPETSTNMKVSNWLWPTNMSISFFIYYLSAPGGSFSRIISTDLTRFEIAYNSSRELYFYAPGYGWQQATGVTLDSGAWTYITFAKSDTNLNVYKNTSLIYQGSVGISQASASYFTIGITYNGFENGNFRISNLEVYNKNLSLSEITQNFDFFKGRFGL